MCDTIILEINILMRSAERKGAGIRGQGSGIRVQGSGIRMLGLNEYFLVFCANSSYVTI